MCYDNFNMKNKSRCLIKMYIFIAQSYWGKEINDCCSSSQSKKIIIHLIYVRFVHSLHKVCSTFHYNVLAVFRFHFCPILSLFRSPLNSFQIKWSKINLKTFIHTSKRHVNLYTFRRIYWLNVFRFTDLNGNNRDIYFHFMPTSFVNFGNEFCLPIVFDEKF